MSWVFIQNGENNFKASSKLKLFRAFFDESSEEKSQTGSSYNRRALVTQISTLYSGGEQKNIS